MQEYDMKVSLVMLLKATKYLNSHVAQVPLAQASHATWSIFEAHFNGEEGTKRLVLSKLSFCRQPHVTIDGNFQPLA